MSTCTRAARYSVHTKFSLAHGYSWCKYLLPLRGFDVYTTAVAVHVVPLRCLKVYHE